jgi:hypothetical protein
LKQDDVWLQATALWEIGLRGLRNFRDKVLEHTDSNNPVLQETAELVMSRM